MVCAQWVVCKITVVYNTSALESGDDILYRKQDRQADGVFESNGGIDKGYYAIEEVSEEEEPGEEGPGEEYHVAPKKGKDRRH